MSFKMVRVHLFHAEVEDKPGGAAAKLKKLAESGAHLEYVYSQRSVTKPGMGDLYVAPIHGNGPSVPPKYRDVLLFLVTRQDGFVSPVQIAAIKTRPRLARFFPPFGGICQENLAGNGENIG